MTDALIPKLYLLFWHIIFSFLCLSGLMQTLFLLKILVQDFPEKKCIIKKK